MLKPYFSQKTYNPVASHISMVDYKHQVAVHYAKTSEGYSEESRIFVPMYRRSVNGDWFYYFENDEVVARLTYSEAVKVISNGR